MVKQAPDLTQEERNTWHRGGLIALVLASTCLAMPVAFAAPTVGVESAREALLPAGMRRFQVSALSAEIWSTRPDGKAWDINGKPDARVRLFLGQQQLHETKIIRNTLQPRWVNRIELMLPERGMLRVVLIDKDLRDDDLIDEFFIEYTHQPSRPLLYTLRGRSTPSLSFRFDSIRTHGAAPSLKEEPVVIQLEALELRAKAPEASAVETANPAAQSETAEGRPQDLRRGGGLAPCESFALPTGGESWSQATSRSADDIFRSLQQLVSMIRAQKFPISPRIELCNRGAILSILGSRLALRIRRNSVMVDLRLLPPLSLKVQDAGALRRKLRESIEALDQRPDLLKSELQRVLQEGGAPTPPQ